MSPRTIAQRYAKALFSLAQRRNELDRIYAEIEYIHTLYAESRLFRALLQNPIYRSQQKLGWLRPVFAEKVSPILWTFLELLLRRGREYLLNETCEAFIGLYDQQQNRLRARVRSAQPLSDTAAELLTQRLRQIYGAETILLQKEVETELIGGFIVEVGTRAADLSVRGRLNEIRKKLLQA
ncbi:MAG: ATP synthase F1 subunit delta [Bacteroidia bacterium]|nr:ATP synthase F1 subunit delta [Bacteroidia bacterium]